MCQGEVCTDDANTNDANADDAKDGQSMIVQGSLVDKPNEPKTFSQLSKKHKNVAKKLLIHFPNAHVI